MEKKHKKENQEDVVLDEKNGAGAEEIPADEADVEAQEAQASDEVSVLTVDDLQAEIEALQERLVELESEAAKNLDGWQRAQASFQNYRRRTETEKENWRVSANAALLTRLLPILDDFKRAFDNVPDALEDHRWLDGVRLVKQKLSHLLDTENVTPIEVEVGDEFDPHYHEAVLTQPVEGLEEGQIVVEAQQGYMQGERVLRPARVVVAAPRPQTEDDEEDEESVAEETETDATA